MMREWISVYQPNSIEYVEYPDGTVGYKLMPSADWAWSCTLCDADSRGTWADKETCVEAALRHGRREGHVEAEEQAERLAEALVEKLETIHRMPEAPSRDG